MTTRFQPARGSAVMGVIARGPTGAAATIAVGTTTTGVQGTSASVSNSGSSSAAVFDFTIPRGSSPAIGWNFDSATTDADPGSGDFRLNNATAASATAAYFDDNERGGTSVTSYLDSWDDTGDATTRGVLLIMSVATPATFHLYRVSGSVTDGTGYRKVTVASLGGNGSFTNGEHVSVLFLPAGPAATANSFETITTPAGTSPVADSPTDTLTLAASAGLSITGNSGTDTITFAPANDLAALEALSSTGLLARTGSETYAQRTLTAPAAGITVTNGDGVSGNPTLVLADDLAAFEGLSSNGIVTRTATSTATVRTITGTASEITVTNGDGVSGNPTLSLHATANPVGKHTVSIPASAFWARTTAGPGTASRELTTGDDIMVKGYAFDTTTEEAIQFYIAWPKGWNEGTLTAKFFWTNSGGGSTETVVWGISAGAFTDDDPMDSTSLGSEVTQSDTWIAQNDLHVTAETSAITVGNTPAEGDLTIFQVARKTASDNLTGDADLLCVQLFYTINAATDA